MEQSSLRIAERDWKQIRRHCAPSFRGNQNIEYGLLGLVGRRLRQNREPEYTVASILIPEPGEVIATENSELTFTAKYMRRAHVAMRKLGLAGIVTIHTHPFSTDRVRFSPYDDFQDPELLQNLQDIEPSTILISLVLGRDTQLGRVSEEPGLTRTLGSLISVGERLAYLPFDGNPPPVSPTADEAFDSASALTGSGAMALLSRLTIVVVGASGTGSIICELLARAGCRRIILIDHDRVEDRNLNRILYATRDDAVAKLHKVEVIKRGIESLGLGCEVIPVIGSILDRDIVARLAEADLVFGCIDKDFPRALLCQYAYQHLVPFIDLGTEIGAPNGEVMTTDARVNYSAPGRPCLRCCGLINKRRLRIESVIVEERKRILELGYSDDLVLKQPAVMDLNMRAASAAMLLLRHLLQPFLKEPYPAMLAENMVTYTLRPIASARNRNPACDLCCTNPHAGSGDCGPVIGLDPNLARRLLG